MVRIGLPKGNVKEKSIEVVKKMFQHNIPKKQLFFSNEKYEIYLLKHRDIPQLIAKGFLDYGITSEEWIVENGEIVKRLKKIDWCDTRISLITSNREKDMKEINCVTEYPTIAKKYFDEKKLEYSIFKISGSSESLIPNLFNCCVDCVETGQTLEDNKLIEREVIVKSSMYIVGRKEEIVHDDIDELKKAVKEINDASREADS